MDLKNPEQIFQMYVTDSSLISQGRGVTVNKVAQQFNQGQLEITNRELDLGIIGEGFFVLKDAVGAVEYTRAGAYSADKDGLVVNHEGQRLQVYEASITPTSTTFNTANASTDSLVDLVLPDVANPASATTLVNSSLNLDADAIPPVNSVFSSSDTSSYNHSSTIPVYDSEGDLHDVGLYYVKLADTVGPPALNNQWQVNAVAGATVTTSSFSFTDNGLLPIGGTDAFTLAPFTPAAKVDPRTGAVTQANPVSLTLNIQGSTQYGGGFIPTASYTDGYAQGQLIGLDIDDTGVVFSRYSNGQEAALGKVALAKFNSPQNLEKMGDTNWAQSFTSGDVLLGQATLAGFGGVQSGTLESSNVNLSGELVNLITAQRNFQANSKGITSLNEMLETIIRV